MLSRRTFLAATLATPAILSRSSARPASDKLSLGFIGVGTMGRGHLGGFLNHKDVEVVALCDVVKERLDSAKDSVSKKYANRIKSGEYKGVQTFNDFRDLLNVPGLDAVVIATPDHWHAIPSVLAARAGKHIYCEKPLTQNLADGRWVVEEVKKGNVVFQTGSQQRSEFENRFRRAVDAIWNGRIGKLKTVRIGVGGPAKPCDLPTQTVPVGTDWDRWLGPAPERGYNEILCPKGVHGHFPQWRSYQEYGGGQIADMGAHHFDIAQWAMKRDLSGPVEIIPPADPKKESGLVFVYDDGIRMIHNEFEGNLRSDCVFEGTDGWIAVSRGDLKASKEAILKDPYPANAERVTPSNNHKQNWLDAIKNKKQAICTAETGHRSASICHLGNIGYRLRRTLKWDPKKEQFVNDAAADKHLIREPRTKWKV
ncbi:MAG: Gfo/Idh/MocA family oxidoreductase [Gemmataceae bacterium]